MNGIFTKTSLGSFIIMLVTGCLSCGGQKTETFKTSDKFSLLWEITGNGLEKPSYLYGTIHIYDTTIFKIPEQVYMAIDSCPNFALELDMNDLFSQSAAMAKRMIITDPDSTLDKLLPPEVYSEVMETPFIKMLGERANQTKPIFLYQYLMVENPMSSNSVDMDLNNYANNHGKFIFGIENIDEQLAVMDSMSLSEQAQGIIDMYEYCQKEGISFHAAGKQMFGKMQQAYKNQDMKEFEKLEDEFTMTASSPVADSAMIANRNINMANRINDFIEKGEPLFAGVGAMHLPDYKDMRGVITLLKEKGYNLRPILIEL